MKAQEYKNALTNFKKVEKVKSLSKNKQNQQYT